MKSVVVALTALVLCLPVGAAEKLQGWCEDGGYTVSTPGNPVVESTTTVQRSYPSCTVTVYDAGTVTAATIYSDSSGTAKANPFTADSNGRWFFYADRGNYDVRFSGGGIAVPYTLGDFPVIGGIMRTVTSYGALGDVEGVSDAGITATADTVTSASANFVAADVGKTILIEGAGAAGALFVSTIDGLLSTTQVSVADNAVTTVAGANAMWGTDDTAAIQAAIDDIPSSGGALYFPDGGYFISSTIATNTAALRLIGESSGGGIDENFYINRYGVTFFPTVDSLSMFEFGNDTGPLIHSGPTLEYLGFIDPWAQQADGEGNATFVTIYNMTTWTARNCHMRDGAMGIDAQGQAPNLDASWGLVSQCVFRNNGTAVKGDQQTDQAGGEISVHAGRFMMRSATQIGVHAKSSQTRVLGVKFNGVNPDGFGICVKIDQVLGVEVIGNDFENCGPGVQVLGKTGAIRDGHSIIGNSFSGVADNGTSITIDAESEDTTLVGNRYVGSAVPTDSGIRTKTYDQVSALWKTTATNPAILGQAGFDKVDLGGSVSAIPGMLVSLNRGIVLRDDPAIIGGLFMSADQAARARVGTGVSGDIAADLMALNAAASTIGFDGVNIDFYSDSSLTPEATFTPTRRFRFNNTFDDWHLELDDLHLWRDSREYMMYKVGAPASDSDGYPWLLLRQDANTGGGLVQTNVFTNPNVVTWNDVNFGTEDQGGFFSVNSRFGVNPNWIKTSSHVSNNAMFMRLAAQVFEIRFGAAANAGGVDPGTSTFKVTPTNAVHNGYVTLGSVAFAGLTAQVAGTMIFCSDCTRTSPCAASGTGAIAKRINGFWECD